MDHRLAAWTYLGTGLDDYHRHIVRVAIYSHLSTQQVFSIDATTPVHVLSKTLQNQNS